jgi:hypothetical protein
MRGIHQGWKVTVLSEKAEYMSATEPYPVIINNHLAKEGRSIYVANFLLEPSPLCGGVPDVDMCLLKLWRINSL